ncbi:hypothetical protein RHS01_01547 [Rhizoctonia solani]|uniref:Uncharacterized protein n=1 Tax=Rhizoctonia solani TaxID=456999 RepID=A0A8H7ILN6_9AGAM|nr:hypothetical protein RHS01_01547 [Rhizoctonia solani]
MPPNQRTRIGQRQGTPKGTKRASIITCAYRSEACPCQETRSSSRAESPVLQPVEDIRKIILERGAALLGVAPILDAESQQDVIPGISTESQLQKKNKKKKSKVYHLPKRLLQARLESAKIIW